MSLNSLADIENFCRNIFGVEQGFTDLAKRRGEMFVNSVDPDDLGVVPGPQGLATVFEKSQNTLALFFHKETSRSNPAISVTFIYPDKDSTDGGEGDLGEPTVLREDERSAGDRCFKTDLRRIQKSLKTPGSKQYLALSKTLGDFETNSLNDRIGLMQSVIEFFKNNEISSGDRSLLSLIETFARCQVWVLDEEITRTKFAQSSLKTKLEDTEVIFSFFRNLEILILKSQNSVSHETKLSLDEFARELHLLNKSLNLCLAIRGSTDEYLIRKIDQLVLSPSPAKSLESSLNSFFKKSVHVKLFTDVVSAIEERSLSPVLNLFDKSIDILRNIPQLDDAVRLLDLKIQKQRDTNNDFLKSFEYTQVSESLEVMQRFVSMYLLASESLRTGNEEVFGKDSKAVTAVAEMRSRFVSKTAAFLKKNFFDKLTEITSQMDRADAMNPADFRKNFELVDSFFKTVEVFEAMREVVVKLDEDFYSLKMSFLLNREQVTALRNFYRYNQFMSNVRKFNEFYQRLNGDIDKKYLKNLVEIIDNFERNLKALRVSNATELIPLLDADLVTIQNRIVSMTNIENEIIALMMKLLQQSCNMTSTVKQLTAVKDRIQAIAQSRSEDLSNFRLFLNAQLFKVTVVSFKELIMNNSILFNDLSELKVQLKIDEGLTRLELMPDSWRLKEILYSRLHESVRVIFAINDTLSVNLVQSYIEKNLSLSLSRLNTFIEGLPVRLLEHLNKQFMHHLSKLTELGRRNRERLCPQSIEDIIHGSQSISEDIQLLVKIERGINEQPASFYFEKSVKVNIHAYLNEINKLVTTTKIAITDCLGHCLSKGIAHVTEYMETVSRLKLRKITTLEEFNSFNQSLMKTSLNRKLFENFVSGLSRFDGQVLYLQSDRLEVSIKDFMLRWDDFVRDQTNDSNQVDSIRKDLEVELERKYSEFKESVKHQVLDTRVLKPLIGRVLAPNVSFKEMIEAIEGIYKIFNSWKVGERQCQNLEDGFRSLNRKLDDLLILGNEIQDRGECFKTRDFEIVQLIKDLLDGVFAESNSPWIEASSDVYKKTLVFLTTKKQVATGNQKLALKAEYLHVLDRMLSFLQSQVKMMQGENFDTANWIEFFGIIFTNYVEIGAVTLRDLFMSDASILASSPRLKLFNQNIAEHHNIRDVVVTIENWTLKKSFVVVEASQYFSDYVVITNIEELQDEVVDFLFQLQAIWDSKFRMKFKKELETSIGTYNRLNGLLSDYQFIQKRLIDLIPFVQHNKRSQDNSLVQYESILKSLRPILHHLRENKGVSDLLQMPDIDVTCREILENLETLKQRLHGYVQEVREGFPRLYLLNENDLLQFIGNCSNTEVLNLHIQKIFLNVMSCEVHGGSVTHVVSNRINLESESVMLDSPVQLLGSDLEKTLPALKEVMTRTLMASLSSKIETLSQINLDLITRFKTLPYQVFLLLLQIQFSKEFVSSIKSMQTDSMRDRILGLIQDITKLIYNEETSKQSERHRHTCMFLISFISVLDEICNNNSNRSWIIFKTVMFKYLPCETGKSDKSAMKLMDVSMNLAGHKISYSWEYQGLKAPLVYTHVTEKMFVSFARSLYEIKGTNLVGPAGTGKTETVKFFGSLLGKFILVFNCDENIGMNTVTSIFKSFVTEDAFLCLDEFNRFNQEQLSLVSQTIQNIQFLIRSNFNGVPFVLKNVENFQELNSGCAIFTTMNPKSLAYSSRYSLPQNLKNLFRTINIANPREIQVFQVILLSEGCVEYMELSRLLNDFLLFCKDNFSRQSYYDWSLRKIKSIFLSFREFKSRLSDLSEPTLLFLSLKTNLVSYLTEEDLLWFNSGVEQIFGEAMTGNDSGCSSNYDGHLPILGPLSDFLVSKSRELVDLINIRNGVIIVGSSLSGKSFLWKYYLSQLSHQGKTFQFKVFNPCSTKVSQIIGRFNKNTGEFIDGYLTETLRSFVEDINSKNRKDMYFIVFDSEINSSWIEALNSVLDDNRMLSLSNGERLFLPSNIKFIVECRHLSHASPATVSRLGLVNMSQSEPTVAQLFIERGSSGPRLAFYTDHISSFVDKLVFKIRKGSVAAVGDSESSKNALVDSRLVPQFEEFKKHFQKNELVDPLLCIDLRSDEEAAGVRVDRLVSLVWKDSDLQNQDSESSEVAVQQQYIQSLFYENLLGGLSEEVTRVTVGSYVNKVVQNFESMTKSNERPNTTNDGYLVSETLLQRQLLVLTDYPCRTDDFIKDKGLGGRSRLLQLEVTKDSKTKDLLLLITQHYKVMHKNKSSFFETDLSQLTIVVRNLQAVVDDRFGCNQLVESLHGLLEHGLISHEGRNIYFHKPPIVLLEFVGSLQSLVRRVPLKVLLRFLVLNIHSSNSLDSVVPLKIRQRSDLGFLWNFLSFDSVRSFVSRSQRFKKMVDFEVLDSVQALKRALYTDLPATQVNYSLEYWMIRVFLEQKASLKLENIHEIYERQGLVPQIYFYFDVERRKVVALRPQQYSEYVNSLVQSNMTDVKIQGIKLSPSQTTLLHMLSFLNTVTSLNESSRNLILYNGVGGGRNTILRVYAAINDIDFIAYQQVKTRENKFEFRMFLRSVLQRIFGERKKVLLVVDEDEIGNSKVLSEVLSLFNCGLFECFFVEDLMMLAQSLYVEDKLRCREEFIKFVTQHLQVCLVFKGGRRQLQGLLLDYPGIFKCFTLFNCKQMIQKDFLENILGDRLSRQSEGPYNASVGQIATSFSGLVRGSLLSKSSNPFVINLVKTVGSIVVDKRQSFESEISHLSKGIQKIVDSENQIDKLRDSIEQKQREIQVKEQDTREAMLNINRIYETEKDRFKNLQSEEKSLIVAEREMISQKEMIQAKMVQITPILESAKSQIKSINKSHLDELRSLKIPPQHVINVFIALMKLKGQQKATFEDAKKIFSSLYEFDQLSLLDFRAIPEENFKKIKEFIEQQSPSFDPKTIYRVSQAAGPIADFIVAMVKCRELYCSIEPMERRLTELESQLSSARSRIQLMNRDVESVERDLQELKNSYILKNSDVELCKKELSQLQINVEISKKILVSLPEEKNRWKDKCDSLSRTLDNILPLSYLSSVYLSFPSNDDVVQKALSEFGSESFDPLSFLKTTRLENKMFQNKINLSTPNLVKLLQAQYFHYSPLIVDPSRKLTKVLIKEAEGLLTVSLTDSNIFFKICTALKTGLTIVVEDFNSECPSFLRHLIKRKYSLINSVNREISLCGKRIQVSSGSRLILVASHLPQDREVNKLYSYTQIVDNTFGLELLSDHYLNLVLNNVDVNLLVKKTDCFQKKVALTKKLMSIENELLLSLNSIESNIVEDETFINYLENIKQSNLHVNEQIRKEELIKEEIRVSEEKYRDLAHDSSLIFLKLSQIASVSPFFCVSLDQFNYIVNLAIKVFQEKSASDASPSPSYRNILLETVVTHLSSSFDSSALSVFLYMCLYDDPQFQISKTGVVLLKEFFSRVCNFETGLNVERTNRTTVRYSVKKSMVQSELFKMKSEEEETISFQEKIYQMIKFIGVDNQALSEVLAEHGLDVCNLLGSNIKNWKLWYQSPDCENHFPRKNTDTELKVAEKLLLLVLFRVDRFFEFVKLVHRDTSRMSVPQDLQTHPFSLMWKELAVPLVISSNEFSDPSETIQLVCKAAYPDLPITDISCNSHNLGTIQSILKSERQGILVLRNLHLVPSFYNELVKLIDFSKRTVGCNLVITTDECESLPMTLVGNSLKIVLKSQSHFDSNFANTISLLEDSVLKSINESLRCVLVQTIQFHSLVCELDQGRAHFSKFLEFGFSELECVLEFFKQNKSIDSTLFLNLLTNLIETSFHGSKCDNEEDRVRLTDLIKQVFSPQTMLKDLEKKHVFGLFDLQALHSVMRKSNFRSKILVPEINSGPNVSLPTDGLIKLLCMLIKC